MAAGAGGQLQTLPQILSRGMVRLIRGYQSVSRWTPPTCRFSPSCSEYAALAITGPWAGTRFLAGPPTIVALSSLPPRRLRPRPRGSQ